METIKKQNMDKSYESNNTPTTDVSTLARTVNTDIVETMKKEMIEAQAKINEKLREKQIKW